MSGMKERSEIEEILSRNSDEEKFLPKLKVLLFRRRLKGKKKKVLVTAGYEVSS